jgi:hypothetical protein
MARTATCLSQAETLIDKSFLLLFFKKEVLFQRRSFMQVCGLSFAAFLVAGSAAAQPVDGARPGNVIGTGMSLPRSDNASNLDSQTTRSELAPALPVPSATDDIQSLLLDARHALQTGQTGEAQEALERAETRALDRSVPQGEERVVAEDPLTEATGQARAALAAGDVAGAIRVIDAALARAADADIPK